MIKGSVRLFKVFGIGIDIHITFLILPFIFGMFYGLRGVTLVLLAFGFVTAHELSHSILAKKFKVKVDSITLLPIGGVANMGSIPNKPKQEFLISIAGPLFNILLSLILAYPLYLLLGSFSFFHPSLATWSQTISYAFWINPILAVFNLVPAFPMDGGRILRAFLASRMSYIKATHIATTLGHVFAFFFVFWGIVSRPPNIILVIIAIFVYIAASQEQMQVEVTTLLKRFYVEDILPNDFFTVTADTKLASILETVFHSHQEDFPVVEDGKLVGVITRSILISSIHKLGLEVKAKDIMIKECPKLKPKDSLMRAQTLMAQTQLKALPVTNEDKLCGIITLEDISKVYLVMANKY